MASRFARLPFNPELEAVVEDLGGVLAPTITDMMSAATVSSLRVLRIRDSRSCSSVWPSAAIRGIMLTPFSNPDIPSTSNGNALTAGPAIP
jgi:4-alpha-glucanotransferase